MLGSTLQFLFAFCVHHHLFFPWYFHLVASKIKWFGRRFYWQHFKQERLQGLSRHRYRQDMRHRQFNKEQTELIEKSTFPKTSLPLTSGHTWRSSPSALMAKWVSVGLFSLGRDSISLSVLSTRMGSLRVITPSEGGDQVASMIFFLMERFLAPGRN
jgi:hypothetical protein